MHRGQGETAPRARAQQRGYHQESARTRRRRHIDEWQLRRGEPFHGPLLPWRPPGGISLPKEAYAAFVFWLNTLRWPETTGQEDPGASYLEPLANLVAVTGWCPPFQHPRRGRRGRTPWETIRTGAVAPTAASAVTCCRALLTWAEQHGWRALGPRRGVKTLQRLGWQGVQGGIAARPVMLQYDDTLTPLQKLQGKGGRLTLGGRHS